MRGTSAARKNERVVNEDADNMHYRQKPPFRGKEAAAELIKQGVGDENALTLYYKRLTQISKTEDERLILSKLHFHAIKHEKLLQKIYYTLTGGNSYDISPDIPISGNARENYRTAFFKEIEYAEYYRCVYMSCHDLQIRDKLHEIITDKQFNQIKLNYLMASGNL